MRYIPNSRPVREEMLRAVGLGLPEELFDVIPGECLLRRPLAIPGPLEEPELARHLAALAGESDDVSRRTCILGGGAYHHYIPAAVRHLVGRAEFYTAYTPYQPEISQGTLQALFEYQTMIARLTGMDVANASLYDGASATAEAVLMARRLTGKDRVVLARALNPLYREVVRTYLQHGGCRIVEAGWDAAGRTDVGELSDLTDADTACVVIQSPNVFGVIEDGGRLADLRRRSEALLIVAITEPISLGLLSPPGEWGADIVAGEGQSFGNPMGFGGPHLGLLACREAHLRQMPGRLVGETKDIRGQRGFVLTLSTREQHIRRDRATSNVCSNEGLCALTAAVYLALLGPSGLAEVAGRNVLATRKALDGVRRLPGWIVPFDGPVFNEFLAVPPGGAAGFQETLLGAGFSGALPAGTWFPECPEGLLFCFTEMVGDAEIERFLALAEGAS